MDKTPKTIRTPAFKINVDDIICGSMPLDLLINYFVNLKSQLESKGFSNLVVECIGYYEDQFIKIVGDRLETAKEVSARIKIEERQMLLNEKLKAKQDAEDLKEYKRLKKKFEKEAS